VGILLLAGFAVRLAFAAQAPHPGRVDPNHYYNLGRSLAAGRGFVIDYVWQYHHAPDSPTHAIDYWMPLPAVWPALGIFVSGDGLLSALVPSAVLGTLVALLAYGVAAAARQPHAVRMMAAGAVIFFPDLLLQSVRTDSAVSSALFAGGAFLAFHHGRCGRPALLGAAGALAGLAHLSRQDGVLIAPALLLGLLLFRQRGDPWPPRQWVLGGAVAWIGVLLPWIVRNRLILGRAWPSGGGRTLFLRSFIDQFTYGRTLDAEHFLSWGIGNILRNVGSMAGANGRSFAEFLGLPLALLAAVGLVAWIRRRDRHRLSLVTPPLLFLGGLFLFYSVVAPFHSEGGSFRKSALSVVPFLAVAGVGGLVAILRGRAVAGLAVAVIGIWMLVGGRERIRAEFAELRDACDWARAVVSAARSRGDANGDGEVRLMTGDPFLFDSYGVRGIMAPSDDLEMILEAAGRYRIDYVVLPAGRAALDTLGSGRAVDDRLPVAAEGNGFRLLEVAGAGGEIESEA
jgi:hypothetical protein